MKLKLRTDLEIETGIPVFVEYHERNPSVQHLQGMLRWQDKLQHAQKLPIDFYRVSPERLMAEFLLDSPSQYTLTLAQEEVSFLVKPHQSLSFGREFGIFSLGIVVLLSFMLFWLKRRPKNGYR